MFFLISHYPDIAIIYLYAKDPYNAHFLKFCSFICFQLLINRHKSGGLKHCDYPKIKYSSDMNGIYENNDQ